MRVDNKTPYKTEVVKTEYLERTLDIMFQIMDQRDCDIRDISAADIYKKGKLNRKTFVNNYHGIGGIHEAVAEEVKRHLEKTLRVRDNSLIQLNAILLIRMLTELGAKCKEVDFSILSADRDFWQTSLSVLEPLLRSAWNCHSETAYMISLQMFSAVFAEVAIAWSKKQFDPEFKSSAASLLAEYAKQIGQINKTLEFYVDSLKLFK